MGPRYCWSPHRTLYYLSGLRSLSLPFIPVTEMSAKVFTMQASMPAMTQMTVVAKAVGADVNIQQSSAFDDCSGHCGHSCLYDFIRIGVLLSLLYEEDTMSLCDVFDKKVENMLIRPMY